MTRLWFYWISLFLVSDLFEHCVGGVRTVRYRGAWIIVDNSYLNWPMTIPPDKHTTFHTQLRWSEWIESLRKDVECTFGIMKGHFCILKTGTRVHGIEATDKIWLTCCALHNWLLEVDGLNKRWADGVPSDWEGDMGLHNSMDVQNNQHDANTGEESIDDSIDSVDECRRYDASGMGLGSDFDGYVGNTNIEGVVTQAAVAAFESREVRHDVVTPGAVAAADNCEVQHGVVNSAAEAASVVCFDGHGAVNQNAVAASESGDVLHGLVTLAAVAASEVRVDRRGVVTPAAVAASKSREVRHGVVTEVAVAASAVRVVRHLERDYFREKLVEHFNILYERNQIIWPKRNQKR